MKTKETTVKGFLAAFGFQEKAIYEWPENKKEMNSLLLAGKIVVRDAKGKEAEIEISEAAFCQMAHRGFGLAWQSGEANLSEEEKGIRKAARKEENEAVKKFRASAKAEGKTLAQKIAEAQAMILAKAEAEQKPA